MEYRPLVQIIMLEYVFLNIVQVHPKILFSEARRHDEGNAFCDNSLRLRLRL